MASFGLVVFLTVTGLLLLLGTAFGVIVLVVVLKNVAGHRFLDMRRVFVDQFVVIKKLYTDIHKNWRFDNNKDGEVMVYEQSWLKKKPIYPPPKKDDLEELEDADGNKIIVAGWKQYVARNMLSLLSSQEEEIKSINGMYADVLYENKELKADIEKMKMKELELFKLTKEATQPLFISPPKSPTKR